MSYTPLTQPLSAFAGAYNGAAQVVNVSAPGENTRALQIDTNVPNFSPYIGSTPYTMDATRFIGRTDALMSPVSSDVSSLCSLTNSANPTYTGGPVTAMAWQDHPARTSYYPSYSDDVLSVYVNNTTARNQIYEFATSYDMSFTIPIGFALAVGVYI
jgi:hypothetical protein